MKEGVSELPWHVSPSDSIYSVHEVGLV